MSPIYAVCVLVLGGFAMLWVVQSALLLVNRESLVPPLQYEGSNPVIVISMKVMVQLLWLVIIFGYPVLIGRTPVEFYAQAFPTPAPWGLILMMAGACISGFVLINLLYLAAGATEFRFLFSRQKTTRRIIGCFLTPVPLAIMEEAVFRGVLLHALLDWFSGSWGPAAAIVLSSAAFSSVHFVRRRDSDRKPPLQPAIGLFFVGVVLGTAYVVSGQELWLPVALHAAGILSVELPRSFVVYKADPVWIGYRSFPHSGPLGILHMISLTVLVWYLSG